MSIINGAASSKLLSLSATIGVCIPFLILNLTGHRQSGDLIQSKEEWEERWFSFFQPVCVGETERELQVWYSVIGLLLHHLLGIISLIPHGFDVSKWLVNEINRTAEVVPSLISLWNDPQLNWKGSRSIALHCKLPLLGIRKIRWKRQEVRGRPEIPVAFLHLRTF